MWMLHHVQMNLRLHGLWAALQHVKERLDLTWESSMGGIDCTYYCIVYKILFLTKDQDTGGLQEILIKSRKSIERPGQDRILGEHPWCRGLPRLFLIPKSRRAQAAHAQRSYRCDHCANISGFRRRDSATTGASVNTFVCGTAGKILAGLRVFRERSGLRDASNGIGPLFAQWRRSRGIDAPAVRRKHAFTRAFRSTQVWQF